MSINKEDLFEKEGLEIDFKKRNINIKGYLLKKGKPLKQRLKEQMDLLVDILKGKV